MPLSPLAPMPLYFLTGGWMWGVLCAGDRLVTPAQLQRN